MNSYSTISTPSEGLYKEKGSKFIAFAYPVVTEDEAKSQVKQIKKKHPKARHHCYAYRVGTDDTVFRANDDGEPSGTAGKPILGQIDSKELFNVIVIVVRYFGGTLLGASGLTRAYKSAAKDAISNAEIISKTVLEHYLLKFEYGKINAVMQILKREHVRVNKKVFGELCELTIAVDRKESSTVVATLNKIRNLSVDHLHSA